MGAKKNNIFFLLQLAENLQMEDLNQYLKKEGKNLPSYITFIHIVNCRDVACQARGTLHRSNKWLGDNEEFQGLTQMSRTSGDSATLCRRSRRSVFREPAGVLASRGVKRSSSVFHEYHYEDALRGVIHFKKVSSCWKLLFCSPRVAV